MLPATVRVPVEIWQIILRMAIYVPLFFDCDPFGQNNVNIVQQYCWELPYWRSERHRNAFRRVCTRWNQYLLQFSHRYIRIVDMVHGSVPVGAFTRAIRLYLGHCNCTWCRGEQPAGRSMVPRSELVADLVRRYGSHSKLEIVHEELNQAEIVALSPITSLKVLITHDYGIIVRSEKTQTLQDVPPLSRIPYHRWEFEEWLSKSPMRLTTITALSIDLWVFDMLERMQIPALRHLSVINTYGGGPRQRSLEDALGHLGTQLETFHWNSRLIGEKMPEDIWSELPNVRSLQTPFVWGVPPPPSHPLCIIRLALTVADETVPIGAYLPVIEGDRSGNRRVVLAHYWCQLLFDRSIYGKTYKVWGAMEAAADAGTTLTDLTNQSLEDYILFCIVHRRGQPRKRRSYWRENDYRYETVVF